ncbi:hypothetical protein XM38_033890 [Halomicronema hongdechloris C2206]|uniref:Uncharacterized protein n=1 Tax=Halomicronema hongdechloris C2206 TaxID=1641165 RepID=A0A1Z3HQA0_9CYAN|nr:hypothetical protein [Halomicronema hongdechloris]ASC72432.1 hypothetical protein XM38_033890 [Halomicronema hongdechloris C2206]
MLLFGCLIVYGLGLVLVMAITFIAFWHDSTTPKTHLMSWVVLILASLFWPITLPSILRALIRQRAAARQQHRQQQTAGQTAQASSFPQRPQMER